LLRGTLSRNSDQYSLAVVYQQLLTGTFPFWHENVYDLLMQHLTGEPDLRSLPEDDRPIVERALSKVPEQRFASCQDLINALAAAGPSMRRPGVVWRRMLAGPWSSAVPGEPSERENGLPPSSPIAPSQRERSAVWDQTQPSLNETPTRNIRAVNPAAA